MKKFLIISFIISVLLILTVSGMILYGKHLSLEQNSNVMPYVSSKQEQYQYKPIPKEKQAEFTTREYYIKNDTDYNLQFLCFNEDECYSLNPDIIEIKNKKFVGFGGYHYYDMDTYKYDKDTQVYNVDVLVDRDPSTDLGVSNKCPFDRGNITHLIFSLTYKPTTKEFQATYKGFASSEDILKYKNGEPSVINVNYLNIYYDNNPKYIKDLSNWLKFFNKDLPKTIGKPDNYGYDIEIEYIIPYYNS